MKKLTGFYCNCAVSSIYKEPKKVPQYLKDKEFDKKVNKFTKVTPLSNGLCPFCGYTAMFLKGEDKTTKQRRKT